MSSSPRYDIRPAHEKHIDNKVHVNRGFSAGGGDLKGVSIAPIDLWDYYEIPDLGELPGVLGL